MKITIDTNKNTVKVNGKDYGFNSFNDGVAIDLMKKFIRANTKLDSYEEDSMWMSYRYCIGRHTIASHMRANDIASHCYGRMSEKRSIFTAYDINREIERCLQFGCGPTWLFPITSLNAIYTSAIDIFCQFVEDFEIKTLDDLLNYKQVKVILADNERGYKIETVTWEEYLRPQVLKVCQNFYNNDAMTTDYAWEHFEKWDNNEDDFGELGVQFHELTKNRPNPDHFYLIISPINWAYSTIKVTFNIVFLI